MVLAQLKMNWSRILHDADLTGISFRDNTFLDAAVRVLSPISA